MRNFYRFHRVIPVAVFPLAGIVSKWKDQVHAKEAPFKISAARFFRSKRICCISYAAYDMQFNVTGHKP